MESIPLLAITLPICILLLAFDSEADRSGQVIPSPDSFNSSSYDSLLTRIARQRANLADAYQRAGRTRTGDSILGEARREFISSVVDSIAPCWFGTTWEFYGTTERPREETIACGYSLSTLLRDAELKVERAKMAQQASERIVKTLAREKEIERFRNVPLDTFVTTIDSLGEGLYVVGLDYHVGFLHHNGTEVRFIHSTRIEPKCVVNERATSSAILASSKYRVIEKISADDELIRKRLTGMKAKTAG